MPSAGPRSQWDFGVEDEAPRLAHRALDAVGGLVAARHRLVGQVGEAQLDRAERRIDAGEARFELLDAAP